MLFWKVKYAKIALIRQVFEVHALPLHLGLGIQLHHNFYLISRDTVVCRVAQEAGTPHPWVINRKNNNAIFTYM